MSMTGAIVNALAIVAGGAVGLLFQRGIPERVSKTVMIGLGLCVLYIGISGAFACQSILIVIVAATLGAAAGALLNIDGAIHRPARGSRRTFTGTRAARRWPRAS